MPTKPLDRLMFAQGDLCFFCEQPLGKNEASVEHLVPSSKGGGNSDDNRVACCKAINALLGSMTIKEKIKVVLRQKGQFRCPNGVATSGGSGSAVRKPSAKSPRADAIEKVVSNLQQRGSARPRTLKTLTNTIAVVLAKDFPDVEAAQIVTALQLAGTITIDGPKVSYAL